MNAIDIAREIFPSASDELLEYIIWGETGYPSFWNIPEDGKTPIECFRTQLQRFKDKQARSKIKSKPEASPDATESKSGPKDIA